MITFGDGAHDVMVRMLQEVTRVGWTVEMLRDGEQPERPDSIAVELVRVDGEGVTGWVLNDLGGRAGAEPRTFDWVTYPHVHIY